MNLSPEIEKQLKKERFGTVKEVVISIIISSLLGGIVSYYVSRNVAQRIAHREFIRDFNIRFFDNPKYRNISIALEEQYLYGKGNIFKINSGPFTDYDVDDYLYLLHDVWSLGESKLIGESFVDDNFRYFVCVTYNNKEIQDYRRRLREEGFIDDHLFLDDFANRVGVAGKNCREL